MIQLIENVVAELFGRS